MFTANNAYVYIKLRYPLYCVLTEIWNFNIERYTWETVVPVIHCCTLPRLMNQTDGKKIRHVIPMLFSNVNSYGTFIPTHCRASQYYFYCMSTTLQQCQMPSGLYCLLMILVCLYLARTQKWCVMQSIMIKRRSKSSYIAISCPWMSLRPIIWFSQHGTKLLLTLI